MHKLSAFDIRTLVHRETKKKAEFATGETKAPSLNSITLATLEGKEKKKREKPTTVKGNPKKRKKKKQKKGRCYGREKNKKEMQEDTAGKKILSPCSPLHHNI